VEEQVALCSIKKGGMPVRRVALSTPEQGKDASAYRTVNVRLSSSYDSHESYIFVVAISICPPLILVVHSGVSHIMPCLWLL
jgi:hypothetical protein